MTVVTGFDDGFFPPEYKGGKGKTLIVGVSVEKDNMRIKTLTHNLITVDGRETTRCIIDQVRYHEETELILLDGITYAGFDVVDPDTIYHEVGVPVATIQQYPLDLKRIKKALSKNFNDWTERYTVIEKIASKYVYLETRWKIIQYYVVGLERDKLEKILRKTMIYSPVPEPLRLAHLIASCISRKLYTLGYI